MTNINLIFSLFLLISFQHFLICHLEPILDSKACKKQPNSEFNAELKF